MNVEPTEIAHEDQVFFLTDDVELLHDEQILQRKQNECNAAHMKLTITTVSHCHKIDKCKNTIRHNKQPVNKVPRILVEQDAYPMLFNFKNSNAWRTFG